MSEELLNEELSEEVSTNNKIKLASKVVGGIVILIIGIFAYRQLIWTPSNQESKEGYYSALNAAVKDSTDLAIDDLSAYTNEFDGKVGGEVAQFVLARQFMNNGEWDNAIEELEGVDLSDTYLSAMSIGLQGDCYSEKKEYKTAGEKYLKAAKVNPNDFTSPTYLFKAGLCAEEVQDFAKAKECYQNIKNNYPQFASQKTIDKYIERSNKSAE